MIILISGSINSGKSTIAKGLKEKIGNTVVLEIDTLRALISEVPLEKAVPINLENAASLIRNFVKHNFNVIVPYPLSEKNYDFILEKLRDIKEKIHIFVLNPKLETALSKRTDRELDDWETERVKYHYRIGINEPDFGIRIDNSSQTPEETTKVIFDLLTKDI